MNTANPYAAPTTPIAIHEVAPQPRLLSGILVGSFFGTVASGAIFGLIGGPFGMVIGGILAVIAAGIAFLPAFTIVGFLNAESSILFRSVTTFAGASAGFLAVMMLAGFDFRHGLYLALAAAVAGGLGSLLGGFVLHGTPLWDSQPRGLKTLDQA